MEVIDSQFFDLHVKNVRVEKSPFQEGLENLVWDLETEDGRKYWRRVRLIDKAKPIIIEDFRKIGVPLTEGLEKGMAAAVGKVARCTRREKDGELLFCYRRGK